MATIRPNLLRADYYEGLSTKRTRRGTQMHDQQVTKWIDLMSDYSNRVSNTINAVTDHTSRAGKCTYTHTHTINPWFNWETRQTDATRQRETQTFTDRTWTHNEQDPWCAMNQEWGCPSTYTRTMNWQRDFLFSGGWHTTFPWISTPYRATLFLYYSLHYPLPKQGEKHFIFSCLIPSLPKT